MPVCAVWYRTIPLSVHRPHRPLTAAPDWAVAGKTGTAQQSKDKPNHGLFIGYAPYDDPEIALAVRITNGYSSANAALVARDVISYYYKLQDKSELITGHASQPSESGTAFAD